MNKNNFTLVELLVVIALASIMLLMGAAAYSKVSEQQALSSATGIVQSAMERARALAIKTKKVAWVFFIDGDGDVFTGKLSNEATPYEVLVIQEDSEIPLIGAKGLKDDTFIEIYRAKLPTEIAWVSPPADKRNGRGIGALGISDDIIPSDRHCSLAYRFPPKGRIYRTAFGRADGMHELRLVNIDVLANADENSGDAKTPLFEYKSETVKRYASIDDTGDYENSAKTIIDNGVDSGAPPSGNVIVCKNVTIDDILKKMKEGKYGGLVWKTIRMDSPISGFVRTINWDEESLTDYAAACQCCYKRNATNGNYCDNCQ